MKRKILAIIIIIGILLSSYTSIIPDARAASESNITWEFDEGTGTFTIKGSGSISGHDIGATPWYSLKDKINTVIIDEGILYIGFNAFIYCRNLSKLILPDSLIGISEDAFSGSDLSKIIIPENVTVISDGAFGSCKNLTDVYFRGNAPAIGENVFTNYNTTLHYLSGTSGWGRMKDFKTATWELDELYSGIKNNMSWHFDPKTGELDVNGTGDMGTSIKEGAPWEFVKPYTKKIIIGDGITDIGSCSFNFCYLLNEVSIPSSVTTIDATAFYGCISLETITIPANIERIMIMAFSHCSKLATVYITGRNISLGNMAFTYCNALKNVYFYDEEPYSIPCSIFDGCPSNPEIYYLSGENDWVSATWSENIIQFGNFLDNYGIKRFYGDRFSDVSNTFWYYNYVRTTYELGLIEGTTLTSFSPNKTLTLAQCIKLAACINSIYATGSCEFVEGEVWYQCYVDYAIKNHIIEAYSDYSLPASRAQVAAIFSSSLPDEAFEKIKTIKDGSISDVSINDSYGPSVYKLYRAGILSGGSDGSFKPDNTITRAEISGIVARIIIINLRK